MDDLKSLDSIPPEIQSRQYVGKTSDSVPLPIYPNGWFCIALSSDIKPKEVKRIYFLGQQLTLIRSEEGKVHLVDAFCPHLGASFNVGGRVVDKNCIQCPFHGWVFSGETGKCTRIPYNKGSVPEQAKVAVWPVVERNNHVYVWYHCDGEEPQWEVPEVEEISNGKWTYKGRTEHEVRCHIQEIPENGADIAHLGYLHLAAANEGNDITKIRLDSENRIIKHYWDGNWEAQSKPNQHVGIMHLDQAITYRNHKIPLTSTKLDAIQIGPGIVHMMFDFGIFGKGIVIQHVTPEGPLMQRSRFVMYSTLPRILANVFMTLEAYQFERDIYVWNNKCFIRKPMLVKCDGPIMKFRRWFNQFYTENSPKLNWDGTVMDEIKSIYDW
uniref:cholesterol 7-desaturase n=1 Tax=Syphacia muris TaxID=451379 RepID=A0A0N5AQU7_9BILA